MLAELPNSQWFRRVIVAALMVGILLLTYTVLRPFLVPAIWAAILAYVAVAGGLMSGTFNAWSASLPVIPATSASSARTLGSSPNTSSPTSARAITSRIAAVGRVTVSERRSIIGRRG